ncbi:MAG: pyridoxamine 5'-phosphate oxidase [Puniceicoccales bacterium]|jgi:pyridoxamine 5'-phosphate oxidase|nr:pyridoxamine 5'-phosphate oxidase [Puniceicoccales bacterium]
MDISAFRQEYTRAGLSRETLAPSPFVQFELWFKQACESHLAEPNAMSLATVSAGGAPSCRAVLLKAFDERGFVFFTNYTSQKAADIEENARVALHFPWFALERQVQIAGTAAKISTKESLAYFLSRPYGSQLGAWVSHQSTVISSRQLLLKKLDEIRRKFAEGRVPLPDFWGGYRVTPQTAEFWQGRPNRLHDRFQYTRDGNIENGWRIERLAP